MEISKEGIALIKQFEGCRLKAYKDAVGIPTIGYGHTKGVKLTDSITQKEADALLKEDLEKYEAHVMYYDETYNYKFNQNEFDALVSFVFNIGSLRGLTNAGRRTKYQIAQKFSAYVNAGGKKLNGLVKRRKAEHDLFVKPIVNSTNKYEVGREYKVKVSGLRTRTDATVNAPIAYPKNLRKGSKIKCLEVKRDTSGNTWIRSEKGWSAALYEGKVYVG